MGPQTSQNGPWHKTLHQALPEDTTLSVSPSIWVTLLLLTPMDGPLPPTCQVEKGALAHGGRGASSVAISLGDEPLTHFNRHGPLPLTSATI